MAFGRIVQGLARSGGAGTTVNVAHNLNNATHCLFGTQDATNYGGGAGTLRTFPNIWTSTKALNTDVLTCSTAAGAAQVSVMACAAHSMIDVGPIVTGATPQTRVAANVSPYVTAVNPGARSMHASVLFRIANGAAASAAVTITHLLQTANVIAIAWPTATNFVSTAGGNRPMFIVQNLGAATATTCELQAQTQDAAVSNAGVDTDVTFDIMVLARRTSNAPWSFMSRPHLTAAGALGDDYGAGDRAQTMAAVGGSQAAELAMYTNIDDLAVGAGSAYTHNLGATGLCLALFEQTVAVGAAYNALAIVNSATSATTMTLNRGNELGGVTLNARVAIFRPHSIVCLPT